MTPAPTSAPSRFPARRATPRARREAARRTLGRPAEPASAPTTGGSAVGELMARSKREIPHFYLATTIDLSHALDWLARHNEPLPITSRVLPAALLFGATAAAARAVPGLNGTWEQGGFRPAAAVDLGVAVSLRDGGLVAPVIPGADSLDVDALMAALRGLVERARSASLRSSDVCPPTITITNLGESGADEVFGVITPPQVAIVGFGRIVERPWAVDGLLGVRPTVRVTLAADHRASDGHRGSRFLAEIDRWLQHLEAP